MQITKRLYNEYEAEIPEARNMIVDSGIEQAVQEIVQFCKINHYSLRDAQNITNQVVSICFSEEILIRALKERKYEKAGA